MKNNKFEIYCDGSCPKQGGAWGYGVVILQNGKIVKQIRGGGPNGTNNIAELTGAIVGLNKVPEESVVTLYSDSRYVVNAFNQGWLDKWIELGWRRPSGPLKNKELWEILHDAATIRDVTFVWVKGHNGDTYNEMADRIAGDYVNFLNNGGKNEG